jgi:murein DD-endopeptidase MepM/ murein hydrolase activator NlpD
MLKKTKPINKKNKEANLKFIKINIICILLMFVFPAFLNNIKADTTSDYQKKIKELQEQQEANKTQITSAEQKVEEYNKELETIDKDIANYSKNLEELQTKLDEINETIKNYEASLQNSSQKHNSAQDIYTTRLRAIYENGIPNVMDLLVTSQGVSDFFSRMNVYSSVLDYDKSLIGNIQNEKEYTDNIKKEIETEKLQIDQLTYDKEKTANTLETAKTYREAKVTALNSNKSTLEKQNELLKQQEIAAKKKMEEEIAKALAASKSNFSGTFSGQFTWPVPGVYKVNAMYRDKEYVKMCGIQHYGLDVGSGYGKAIVAAADGEVDVAKYNTGGYGYYILINHGKISSDGSVYRTLYGHNSTLLVSEGQRVTKGQKIALSGNTGFSTGAHLHFEVRKYSGASFTTIDPMNYFSSSGAPFTYWTTTTNKIISYPFDNLKNYQY